MIDPLDYDIFLNQGRVFPVQPLGYWIAIDSMSSTVAADAYLDLLVWSGKDHKYRAKMSSRVLARTVLAKALVKQIKEGEKA